METPSPPGHARAAAIGVVLLLSLVALPTTDAHHSARVETNLPSARDEMSAVWDPNNGVAYLFGGRVGSSSSNDILEFDPSVPIVTDLPQSLPNGLRCSSAVWDHVNDRAIIVGGADGSTVKRQILGFTPGNPPATLVANMGFDRICNVSVLAGNTVYIFGGCCDSNGNNQRVVSTLTLTGAYTSSIVLSGNTAYLGKCCHSGVHDGANTIYLFGGSLDSGAASNHVVRFDTSSNTVSLSSHTVPTGLYFTAAVWDDAQGRAYLIGGTSSSGNVRTVYAYDPSSGFSNLGNILPQATAFHSAVWDGDDILVFGGNGGNDDVVRYDPLNLAPAASISAPSPVECTGPSGASVTVDGGGSSDPDGDAISGYSWSGASFSNPSAPSTTASLPLGTTNLGLSVTDEWGHSGGTSAAVTVQDTTAPSTTAAPSGTLGDNDWYRSDVSVALTPTDLCDTAPTPSAAVDGGAFGAGSPVLVSGEGTHTVDYRSTDASGNVETTKSTSVKIDTVAPSSTAAATGPSGNAGWFRGTASVAVSGTDATSGVASSSCSVDGGTVGATPCSVGGDGVHDVAYHSTDVAGNVEADKHLEVKVDATAPVTSAVLDGTLGDASWWRSTVDVGLVATDATSGVDSTSGSLDGVPQSGTSFPVSGDGTHSISYSSTDKAGNLEASKSQSIKIDTVAPSTTASVSGTSGSNGWFVSDVVLSFSATDATSGVATTSCSIDGAPATTGSTCTVSSDGAHTVGYHSRDKAGNQEATQTVSVKVDQTAPVTTASITGTQGDDGWYRSTVGVNLVRSDAASGVDTTEHRLNGGPWTTGTFVTIAADGIHTLEFRSTDVAGNVESVGSVTVKIDTGVPAVDLLRPDAGTLYLFDVPQTLPTPVTTIVGGITLEASASDPGFGSGIDRVEFLVDGQVVGTDSTPSGSTYSFLWSPGLTDLGTHVITARGVDVAGNADTDAAQALVVGL